jgi:hypothetical protein
MFLFNLKSVRQAIFHPISKIQRHIHRQLCIFLWKFFL